MAISPLAGKPATREYSSNAWLRTGYYGRPDPSAQRSGSCSAPPDTAAPSLDGAFNEAHILAITQAICDYRKQQSIDGPLYMGNDTHALSEPAFATRSEVLAANDVETMSTQTTDTRRRR